MKKHDRGWPKLVLICLFALLAAPRFLPAQTAGGDNASQDLPRIALLGFALTGVTEEESILVVNKLRSELVNSRKFRVMTRN